MMRDHNGHYLSYLVRIWKDSAEGDWRAIIQDVFDGNRYHFASLHELYVNLLALASDQENNSQPGLSSKGTKTYLDPVE